MFIVVWGYADFIIRTLTIKLTLHINCDLKYVAVMTIIIFVSGFTVVEYFFNDIYS